MLVPFSTCLTRLLMAPRYSKSCGLVQTIALEEAGRTTATTAKYLILCVLNKDIPLSDALLFGKITKGMPFVCGSSRRPRPSSLLTFKSPILTYRNRGTAMPGVEPAHHAIIFTESKYGHLPRSIRHPPFKDRDELPLPNAPICVEPIDPKHQFDVMSRLNYAELYKVEHGIKVYFIGRIHEASVKEFEASYERVQQMVNALKVQRRVHEMYRGDDGVQKEEDGEDVHPDNRNFMY